MTSPILYEAFYTGAFLVREGVGYLSRDAGVMFNSTSADVPLGGGLVVSLDTPGTATATPLGTNVGNGTFGPITVADPAVAGVYVVNLEGPSGFTIEGPAGAEFGHGTVGTAFSAGGLGFTITAGGTAFAAGDSFTITVAAGDGGYRPFTGVAPAAAILFNRVTVPANGSAKVTVIKRNAEVNGAELVWDPSVASNPAAQAAALAQLALQGIVSRPTAPSAG